jgi:hypothetical protein
LNWWCRPAWAVVREECGPLGDLEEMEDELRPFLGELKVELRSLRESV